MHDLEYSIAVEPRPEDLKALYSGIRAFNVAVLGEYSSAQVVTAFVKDSTGQVVGGVRGEVVWSWLHIWTLWVDERMRRQGVGMKLLSKIERHAQKQGVSRIRLETTDFQALDFYRKLGYQVFAELPELPPGHISYFLTKAISGGSEQL